MSGRDFDADALTSAWGSRPPVDDRRERVLMVGRAARALMAGEIPDDEARLFVASALAQWLESGGSLEADYLRVHRRGSHLTPARIWARQSFIADEDSEG